MRAMPGDALTTRPLKVCTRGLPGAGPDVTCRPCPVPCGSAHLAKIRQVGVTIGASSTDSSEPSIAHDACSQHSLRRPPSAAWSVPRPHSPTPNHRLRRRHPGNRLMRTFLRCRGSSACISTSSCRVKRSFCRRCPTRPEPQTGRNDLRDRPRAQARRVHAERRGVLPGLQIVLDATHRPVAVGRPATTRGAAARHRRGGASPLCWYRIPLSFETNGLSTAATHLIK
jgi:hypothetical protein